MNRLRSFHLDMISGLRVRLMVVYSPSPPPAAEPIYAEGPGTIYFITMGDPVPQYVKIGYTSGKPKKRMAALQTGCPVPLSLFGHVPGSMEIERRLHMELAEYCSHGEWFRFEERVERVIDSLLQRGVC